MSQRPVLSHPENCGCAVLSKFTRPITPRSSSVSVDPGSIARWRAFAIAMLVLGALAIEAILATHQVSTTAPGVVHGSVAVLAILGVTLARTRGWETHLILTRAVILATTLVITGLVATVNGLTMIPVFYVWPLLGSAFLLTRAEVVGGAFATIGLFAIALTISGPPGGFPGLDFALTVVAGVVVVVVVRVLAESLGTTIDSLRLSSSTDPLTGLLNRRAFYRQFARQFDRARHDDRPITALLIDIDHFKAINDRFGHGVGDQALLRFSDLLSRSCRAGDLVARVGGEEFAVVMPGATLEQAIARAEQFCGVLRGDRAVDGVSMTASVGVALRDASIDGIHAMLAAADEAVYEAKRTGRDRIVVADAGAPDPGARGGQAGQAA